jgi:hypothetical protein
MTDDYSPTPDEILSDEARRIVATPPEPIPGAEGLPADVRDGHIEDDGSTVEHREGE